MRQAVWTSVFVLVLAGLALGQPCRAADAAGQKEPAAQTAQEPGASKPAKSSKKSKDSASAKTGKGSSSTAASTAKAGTGGTDGKSSKTVKPDNAASSNSGTASGASGSGKSGKSGTAGKPNGTSGSGQGAKSSKSTSGQKKGADAAGASTAAPEKSTGDASKSPKKVVVTDVQVYSGRDYSRVVLVLSGEPTGRRWQLLKPQQGGDGVGRLYVDLDNVIIRSGVPSRFDVKDDVARRVRLSYFKPDVARLVIEVENLKSQNVFVLENPYRVIVDVQGEAARAEAPAKGGKPVAKPAKDLRTPEEKADSKADKPGSPGIRLDTPSKRKLAGQLVEQLGLTVHTVMVDAGHGGRDSGARGALGLHEKNVTLKVARMLGDHLKKLGFEVLYTRTTDKYVPLEMRTAMANAQKADLFVSVHCNAHGDPGSSGMETYSLNLASTPHQAKVAARENAVDPKHISDMQNILDELLHASKISESRDFARDAHKAALAQARKTINLRDRGVHEAPFYVLLGAKMPAILVEIGYITNPVEAAKLKDDKYLDGLAAGIASGVRAYKDRIERYARN